MASNVWNPWHGCIKKSEGCDNCYVYFFDEQRGCDASKIYKIKNNFNYPTQRDKNGQYKIKSGEEIATCLTSDFFLEEADAWRNEAWDIIKQRSGVVFFIITKRPERILKCLPKDWGDGWENVFINATCENQKRFDERVPILLDLPLKHRGIIIAPFIGEVSILKYINGSNACLIHQIVVSGENYEKARVLKYNWVKKIHDECVELNISFRIKDIGMNFEKDGKIYNIFSKKKRDEITKRSGLDFIGREYKFNLVNIDRDLFDF